MGHHYIPKFYLKGFEYENLIWVYSKGEKKPFRTQIKSIANETKLYSRELEDKLNSKIEIPAQSAIETIRGGTVPPLDQKRALADYLCAMWKRVPSRREHIEQISPEVASELENEICSSIEELASASPDITTDTVAENKKNGVK